MTPTALAPIRVETAELDERRRSLEELLSGLSDCAITAVRLQPVAERASPGRATELAVLAGRLRDLERQSALLRDALGEAAVGYERAEESAADPRIPQGLAPLVSVIGFGRRAEASIERRLPGAVEDAAQLVRATAEAAFGSAEAAARALAGEEGAREQLSEEGDELVRALLGDPLVLEGIRALISTIGLGTEIGVLLIPPPIAAALGAPAPEDLVGEGVGTAAGVLVALGTLFGALPDPGERTVRVESEEPPPLALGSVDEPPGSWGELAARIPPSDPEGAQVVIERYGEEWLVTVSGTTDWSGDPEQAFGAASNLQAMTGGDGASVTGTLAAMEAAGVPPGAPVTMVAHSQGGLVAMRVAQSGRYDVHDLIAFGSPARGLALPEGTAAVSVEHADDLVPALSGFGRTSAPESGVVVVERDSPAGTPR